ncbi:hypothetical protein EV137_2100 [Kribbella pratensis]|uniref:Sensor domain-containing protein n=2 Tax=Kribbella TaxID=182639 RepID=A0ABY2FPT8_9ACTN|nr:hypothetical protein [Kribbella pratensis]TDW94779.1 hypothetical protein EV137_2100 [Kribbella pratensis]TDX03374.1 hypothetical protein EV647_1609 [Kribbella sp. VKM Ac-2566]
MIRSVSFPLTPVLMLSLAACGGGDDKQVAGPPPSTPAPTSTATASTPAAPVTRTTAELTKAMLELADLPSGFTEDKEEADEGSKPFSSSSSRCKTLVKYLNATKAPGSKASVTRTFTGGQEGPYIDYGLDAMGTADDVTDLRDKYAEAVDSCTKLTLKTDGAASTSMKVEKITAPQYGSKPFAFRLTGTSGPKRGLEYAAVVTGVDDVIISVGVLAGQGTELDPATEAAVTKARHVLKPA